jgi:hypothetical protein
METEFQNQEELDTALAEDVIADGQPMTEYPQDAGDELREAGVALEWMGDLLTTISTEGASRDDIRAVYAICDKLNSIGMNVKVSAGLEAYGPNHFTPQRSLLNQSLGLEGLGATIVATVKSWFQKLIDYLARAYRFVRDLQHRDSTVSSKIESAIKAVEETQSATDDIIRLVKEDATLHDAELMEFVKRIQLSPQIKRTPLTAAGFGDSDYLLPILRFRSDLVDLTAKFQADLDQVTRYVDGVGDTVVMDMTQPDRLETMTVLAGQWMAENPDPKFLFDYITFATLMRPFNRRQREAVTYQFLVETYSDSAKQLKSIKGIKLPEGDDSDPEALAELSRCVSVLSKMYDNLGKMANFFSTYNRAQLAVIAAYCHFHKKRRSLWVATLLESPLEGRLKEQQQKAEEKLNGLFKGLGF